MNSFINFFLSIRNSQIFNIIVISVIVASAIYAGVSSYDISPEYIIYLDLFDYAITIFFVVELDFTSAHLKRRKYFCSSLA
jgi:voltage-gated sodium channel